MSLYDEVESADINEGMLVDWLGFPSPFKAGERSASMHTIAYRKPTDKAQMTLDVRGEKVLNATPVYELDLYPGLNEIEADVWAIIKSSLDHLTKPYKRRIAMSKEELGKGEESFVTEKLVKEKPLLLQCGSFSSLTPERAAELVERCVNEKLLAKFAKTFKDSEEVQEAVKVQLDRLDSAVIKH